MTNFLWNHYLYFGESRLALPLAAWIAVCLAVAGQGMRALCWTVSFGIGATLVMAAKSAFSYSGWSLPSLGVYSVSGHAMLTAAVYPVLLMLLGSALGRYTGWLGLAAGVALALFMPVVLVTDFHHTVGESLIGLGVGLAVAGMTLWRWQPVRRNLRKPNQTATTARSSRSTFSRSKGTATRLGGCRTSPLSF